MTDLWNYRTTARTDTATDLTGFQVVANDGSIGKIDQATYEVGTSYVVVDTGPWIFGKKRMLPAGVLDRVDYDEQQVFVNMTKEQIRQAPDYDDMRYQEEAYRTDVGDYYARF